MVPDYVMGCKRILISDEFYSALNKPCYNLDNSGIVEFSEKGIVTKDAEHELDVIIFATGFDLSSNFNFLVEVHSIFLSKVVYMILAQPKSWNA